MPAGRVDTLLEAGMVVPMEELRIAGREEALLQSTVVHIPEVEREHRLFVLTLRWRLANPHVFEA